MPVANRVPSIEKNAEVLHSAVLAANRMIRVRDDDGNKDVGDVQYSALGPKTRARYEALVSLLASEGLWNLR